MEERKPYKDNVTHGPTREDGYPAYVTWNDEDFDTPSEEEIHAWALDSRCETLDGQIVEPDGHAVNGCPSWLIALELI